MLAGPVTRSEKYDAVVVGSGPNGLAAAITVARAGLSVLVIEGHERIGGGCRTAELTLPGFHHDVCAAIHPMAVLSPVFREAGLDQFGLAWAHPKVPLAHPLPGRPAALLHSPIGETASGLGPDARVWTQMFQPLFEQHERLFDNLLRPARIPKDPLLMARFGLTALRSCTGVLGRFRTEEARALFAGCAAHSILPLDRAGTAAFGLVLALSAHAAGWPCARGGSGRIIDALETCLRRHGGVIQTGTPVRRWSDLPEARAVLMDLTPRQVAEIAGSELPSRFLRACQTFQHGPGVFKVDWALSGPIPWADPACAGAATVHVGGTAAEVIESEAALKTGAAADRPFVLLAQQSLFDPARAPAGKHTGWAYCHVPNGCPSDMTGRIETQIERFAPGFKDLILARHTMSPARYEAYNPNFAGGDIGGGANTLAQVLFRPSARWDPYSTPNPRLFLCSSATPPGGGVHGMCGYWAARSALRRIFGR